MQQNPASSSSRCRLLLLILASIICLLLATACYGVARTIFPPETHAPEVFPNAEIIFSTSGREVGFVNVDGTNPKYVRLVVKVHGNSSTVWPWRPVMTGDNRTLIVRMGDDVYFGSGSYYLALWYTGALPVLCENWLYQQKPLLAADQQHIFIQVEQATALYTLDSCGTEEGPIKVYENVSGIPSPDFQYVAYTSRGDDLHDHVVAVRNMDSGEERIIGEGDFPAWSRDSQWLAYTGVDGIYIVNVLKNTDPVRVVLYQNPVGDVYPTYSNINQIPPPEPSWSPDGKWLVYHRLMRTDPDTEIDPSSNAIYKLNIETGEEIKILDGGMYPYWRWPAEEP